eukprot:6486456-Amphidinium_carterae.2
MPYAAGSARVHSEHFARSRATQRVNDARDEKHSLHPQMCKTITTQMRKHGNNRAENNPSKHPSSSDCVCQSHTAFLIPMLAFPSTPHEHFWGSVMSSASVVKGGGAKPTGGNGSGTMDHMMEE